MGFKQIILAVICSIMVGCASKQPNQPHIYTNNAHSFSIQYDQAFEPMPHSSGYTLLKCEAYQRIMSITANPIQTPVNLNNASDRNQLLHEVGITGIIETTAIAIQGQEGLLVRTQINRNQTSHYLVATPTHLIAFNFKSTRPNMQWAEDIMATLHWANP